MTTIIPDQPTPRRTDSGMRTRAVNAAAGVLQAAMEQGRQLPVSLAIALDSARLLNSPEHAAHVTELEIERHSTNEALSDAAEQLRANRDRIAELEAEREKLVRWHAEDGKAIDRLVARVERRQAELVALRNDALAVRGSLAPADGPRAVPFELGETLTPAVDWLIARVAELETDLAAKAQDAEAAVNGWGRARDRIAELEAAYDEEADE